MSEEFEDFGVEEEGGRSRFGLIAGLLIATLIGIVICVAAVLFVRNNNTGDTIAENSLTATAITMQNATTEARNALVTQTVIAMTEEASRPTATPTDTPVPPTETPEPTSTSGPTETPVVQEAGDGTGDGEDGTGDGEDGTPNAQGTSIFDDASGATATAIAGGGSSDGSGLGGGGDTLPDTGLGLAEALAVALGLLAVLFVARRLRFS